MSLTILLSEQRSCSGVGYSDKPFIRHTPKASQQPAPTTPAPLQWPEMPAEASVDPYSRIAPNLSGISRTSKDDFGMFRARFRILKNFRCGNCRFASPGRDSKMKQRTSHPETPKLRFHPVPIQTLSPVTSLDILYSSPCLC